MTNWIEVALRVDGEAAEAIAEVLQRYGHQGVLIEHDGIEPDVWDEGQVPTPERVTVRAYFQDDSTFPAMREQFESALKHLNMMYPMPDPVYRSIEDKDWTEAWKVNYKPVKIGQRLLVQPEWIETEPEADQIIIRMDPGMAFGTGTHPTTQLCLEALEWLAKPTLKMLDLGCGSGILSIAAAKLGVTNILALDIDPVAVESTRENARRNTTSDSITAQTGSLETVITSPRRFDLVVVNILAKIILKMCDQNLGDVVRPGGKAIFSGILLEQADEVEAALRRTGLEPIGRHQKGDWILIETKRPA